MVNPTPIFLVYIIIIIEYNYHTNYLIYFVKVTLSKKIIIINRRSPCCKTKS